MLVGVISDTHRHRTAIKKIVSKVENVDVLIHLGDNADDIKEIEKYYKGKIINVRGNCDLTTAIPEEITEVLEGKRFLITHGHRYGVKNNLFKLRFRALEVEADIVLYGHSHISQIDYEEKIWYINPGSAAESRDGYNSVAIIEISEGKIEPKIIRI